MAADRTTAASYQISRQLLLRGLGLVYAAAFLSIAVQAQGLIGHNGVLPMVETLARADAADPTWSVLTHPTLFWADRSDFAIDAAWCLGALFGIVVSTGYAQLPCLIGCWLAYLTLAVGGGAFFDAPADHLLLEAGVLAIFLAPQQWTPRLSAQRPPSRLLLALFAFLAIRATWTPIASGLLIGGQIWRNGTVLQNWLIGQPLPTWIGWHASHLDPRFLTAAAFIGMAIVLASPLLAIAGRRGRRLLAVAVIAFQIGSCLFGNRGVFPFLVAVSAFSLIDDAAWKWLALRLHVVRVAATGLLMPAASESGDRPLKPTFAERVAGWLIAPVAVALFLCAALSLARDLGFATPVRFLAPAERVVGVWRLAGSYRSCTAERCRDAEVVIDGSDDGVVWRPFQFSRKPDDLAASPSLLGPHLPRLDWRLAQRSTEGDPQLIAALVRRLLEDQPNVVALFANDPFPEGRPTYIRVRAFRLTPATAAQHADGYWWRRAYLMDIRDPSRLTRHDEAVVESPRQE